jgi:hypothetical protein
MFRMRQTAVLEYSAVVTGLMYCVFMLFTSVITRYEQFTNRLLSPMLIPLFWCLSYWIPGFLSKKTFHLKWAYGLPLLILAAWFMNTELRADWEYYDGVKDAGIPGYQEDEVKKSDIVQFIEKNKTVFDTGYPIYSNAGDAVYFFTGLPAFQLPFVDFPDQVGRYYAGYNNQQKEYLLWFNNLDNPDMPGLDSILQNKQMVLLKQLSDGAVFITK